MLDTIIAIISIIGILGGGGWLVVWFWTREFEKSAAEEAARPRYKVQKITLQDGTVYFKPHVHVGSGFYGPLWREDNRCKSIDEAMSEIANHFNGRTVNINWEKDVHDNELAA